MTYSAAQLMFLALVFFVASGIPLGAWALLRRNTAQRRLDRLAGGAGPRAPEASTAPGWVETVARAAKPLAKLSIPDEGWEASGLRRSFMQAGWRDPNAPTLYFAIKTILAFGLPLLLWLVRALVVPEMKASSFVLWTGLLCSLGFYAPNLLLAHMTKLRQREIFESFPDALDLLTICVEAGLGLEAALNRVAGEIRLKSETLADELQLVCLEFRAGGGKERALRNLALRTGVEDVDTLVAMLVQSEKFGTGIGDSLRIHSEMLRVKRQHRAEERAAKVALKLIFPLVTCIFPSILIVVAGPAMIRIIKELPKLVGGGS
jgi:tight adherence protein C